MPHEANTGIGHDEAMLAGCVSLFENTLYHHLQDALDDAPDERGVYGLYWREELVYVGKAVGTTRLRRRLREHAKKIGGRQGISLADMKYRVLALRDDWMVVAAESALIEKYKPEWNGSGFGSHVPGRGRPGIHPVKWDEMFRQKPANKR